MYMTRLVPLIALLSFGITSTLHAHTRASMPEASNAADARKIEFPDTEGYQTLVVDLHTHSVFSDGHVWPRIRVEEALRDGLDAMAVTEHLEYQPHIADIPHPDRNRAFAETQAAADGTPLIVIAGSEITRGDPAGHINAVFIDDANSLMNIQTPPQDPTDVRAHYDAANAWPAQNAVDAAASQGAFIFWNHPYWTQQKPDGIARINAFHKSNAQNKKLHGIEVANGNDYSEEAHAIALEHNLALIGVSDVHNLIDWDYEVHNNGHRPVNLVLATERSAQGIKDALFAQRTLVWFKNLLIARPAEMNAMLNAAIEVVGAEYGTNDHVLTVRVANKSDARFELRNLSKMTFMDHADRIALNPHATTAFKVKPGQRLAEVAIEFAVENALIAPKQHPKVTMAIQPINAAPSTE